MTRLSHEAKSLPWIVPMPAFAPHCLHCGESLRPVIDTHEEKREIVNPETANTMESKHFRTIRVSRSFKGWGYQCNGRFCTLRCGYWWALKRTKLPARKSRAGVEG